MGPAAPRDKARDTPRGVLAGAPGARSGGYGSCLTPSRGRGERRAQPRRGGEGDAGRCARIFRARTYTDWIDRSGRRRALQTPSRSTPPPPLRSAKKKRREAGEVASRRAGANTGKLFATGCLQSKACARTQRIVQTKSYDRRTPPGRVTRFVTLELRAANLGPARTATSSGDDSPGAPSARNDRHAVLGLLPQRVAQRARLRLARGGGLQAVELSGV